MLLEKEHVTYEEKSTKKLESLDKIENNVSDSKQTSDIDLITELNNNSEIEKDVKKTVRKFIGAHIDDEEPVVLSKNEEGTLRTVGRKKREEIIAMLKLKPVDQFVSFLF